MSVQFWVALDGDNRITINKALKGVEYTCLECNGKMIPKKGEIRTHHFAHKSEYTCSGEGQKHLYVKELIYEILCMNQKKLLPDAEVRIEKYHLNLQPDVSVHWLKGSLKNQYLAIEVHHTSESTDVKKQTYGDNMVEFNIEHWSEEEMTNPFFIFNEVYPALYSKVKNMEILALENKKHYKVREISILGSKVSKLRKEIKGLSKELNANKDRIISSYKKVAKKEFEEEANTLLSRRKKLEKQIEALNSELEEGSIEGSWGKTYSGDWLVTIPINAGKQKYGTVCRVISKKGETRVVKLLKELFSDHARRFYSWRYI